MTVVQRLSRALRLDVFLTLSAPLWALVGALLSSIVVAKLFFDVPFHYTMNDPATASGERFYLGVASNVGALLWAANASILFFSYALYRRVGGDRETGRFLLCSGLFVALLAVDDVFLLHEVVFPDHLGVPQSLVVVSYGAIAVLYVARFALVLSQTAYPVAVVALGLLGLSAGFDQLRDLVSAIEIPGELIWEDAAKLFGIGTWLSYSIHTGTALLLSELRPVREPIAAPEALTSSMPGAARPI